VPPVTVGEIDPLQDARWPKFLDRHESATVFHSPAWLDALSRTYGYRVSALSTSGSGTELSNGLVFCRVRSWLTGSRAVSLPFSDHCVPLVSREDDLFCLLSALRRDAEERKLKYVEVRTISGQPGTGGGLAAASAYCLHRLDLRPSLDDLFRGFHRSSLQRRISRAERESLEYEEGRSEDLLRKFYGLAVLTRRRQQLPPQPLAWFRNLIASLGDQLKIRLVSFQGRPAAGILTLRYKATMTYKYGCSDRAQHRLGTMPLLLWRAIQDAKQQGLTEFDMGRSDWTNEGLVAFKDHWGATRSTIAHLRYPALDRLPGSDGLGARLARQFFARAPRRLLTTAGNILYRHMA